VPRRASRSTLRVRAFVPPCYLRWRVATTRASPQSVTDVLASRTIGRLKNWPPLRGRHLEDAWFVATCRQVTSVDRAIRGGNIAQLVVCSREVEVKLGLLVPCSEVQIHATNLRGCRELAPTIIINALDGRLGREIAVLTRACPRRRRGQATNLDLVSRSSVLVWRERRRSVGQDVDLATPQRGTPDEFDRRQHGPRQPSQDAYRYCEPAFSTSLGAQFTTTASIHSIVRWVSRPVHSAFLARHSGKQNAPSWVTSGDPGASLPSAATF
jgi:hypothetical protein